MIKDVFSFTFNDLIEQMCNDPMFIEQCEKNNREWDEEVAEELDITVEELHKQMLIK